MTWPGNFFSIAQQGGPPSLQQYFLPLPALIWRISLGLEDWPYLKTVSKSMPDSFLVWPLTQIFAKMICARSSVIGTYRHIHPLCYVIKFRCFTKVCLLEGCLCTHNHPQPCSLLLSPALLWTNAANDLEEETELQGVSLLLLLRLPVDIVTHLLLC